MRLLPLLPEIVLTLGAIALMMVAAFVRRPGRITSGGAVALLCAATVMLIGAPQTAGPLFGGLVQADAFGAFGKTLIFLGAAGRDYRRAWLVCTSCRRRRPHRAWRRISRPDPV